MEEREVSLKAYVLERFGREIGLAVENYILEHPDVLDLKKVRVPGELTGAACDSNGSEYAGTCQIWTFAWKL